MTKCELYATHARNLIMDSHQVKLIIKRMIELKQHADANSFDSVLGDWRFVISDSMTESMNERKQLCVRYSSSRHISFFFQESQTQ